MPTLKVKMGSLELDNPMMVSSGDVAKDPVGIMKCDRYRPGAIVMKAALIEEEFVKLFPGWERGRKIFTRAQYAWPGTDGLVGTSAPHDWSSEQWCDWLANNRRNIETPLIAQLMSLSVDGYVRNAKMFEEAGADAIEINYGCPVPALREFPYAGPLDKNILDEILTAVRPAVKIPLGVKNGSFPWAARMSHRKGLEYCCINSVDRSQPPIDIETMEPVIPAAHYAVGSGIFKYRNYLTLTRVSDIIDNGFHVSVCGGILKWQDIIESTMYGATSMQMQSLFLRKGIRVVDRMKRDLLDYMERHNLETLDEIRGIVIPKIIGEEESAQAGPATKGKVIAVVDEDKCTGCGICEDVCYYEGIKVVDRMAVVNENNCEGCRACVMDCPEGALSLRNVEMVYEIARKWLQENRPEVAKHGIMAQDPRDRKSLGLKA